MNNYVPFRYRDFGAGGFVDIIIWYTFHYYYDNEMKVNFPYVSNAYKR
jgi:hypothetical protein